MSKNNCTGASSPVSTSNARLRKNRVSLAGRMRDLPMPGQLKLFFRVVDDVDQRCIVDTNDASKETLCDCFLGVSIGREYRSKKSKCRIVGKRAGFSLLTLGDNGNHRVKRLVLHNQHVMEQIKAKHFRPSSM